MRWVTKVNDSNTHKIGNKSVNILAIQTFQQNVIGESEMDVSDILSVMSNISQLYIYEQVHLKNTEYCRVHFFL